MSVCPNSKDNRPLLERKAEAYAATHHGGTKYSSGRPYTYHLGRTAAIMREVLPTWHPWRDDLLAAAWLHDIVEDTKVSVEDLAEKFGRRVADLVWAVTDERGRTREERKRATYPKIRATPGAVLLKLCDRLANLEEASGGGGSFLTMYAREHPLFHAELHNGGVLEEILWERINLIISGRN